MWNYIYPNELYHHGIKGQKWGVRRFQNADGSLTKLGQSRYYSDKDRKDMASQARKNVSVRDGKSGKSSLDYSLENVDDIREAGKFLKGQQDVVYENFNGYYQSVQKNLVSLRSDKKFIDECKEEMKKSLNGNYDDEDIAVAAYNAVNAKMYKYESPDTKRAFEKFDKSANDYRDNLKSMTDDIVGEYGDRTIASYKGAYGKNNVSYKEVTQNTLRNLGNGAVVDYLQGNRHAAYYNDGAGSVNMKELIKTVRDDYMKD